MGSTRSFTNLSVSVVVVQSQSDPGGCCAADWWGRKYLLLVSSSVYNRYSVLALLKIGFCTSWTVTVAKYWVLLSVWAVSLVNVLMSYSKLAEEEESGIMPFPAVGKCELVGLDQQMILDYQLLAFMLRTQSWLSVCVHIIHKWIKKQQNRDWVVVAVIVDTFWISRNLSDWK